MTQTSFRHLFYNLLHEGSGEMGALLKLLTQPVLSRPPLIYSKLNLQKQLLEGSKSCL